MTVGELGIVLAMPRGGVVAAIGHEAADLTQMSALELAEAIRSKQVSSEEVIFGGSKR